MKKLKKRSKRILVFLLLLGLTGGMMDPLAITASATDVAESGSTEGGADLTIEEENAQPACTCTVQCTSEAEDADCPVCTADLSGCSAKAQDGQADESQDADTGLPANTKDDAEDPTGGSPSLDQPDISALETPLATSALVQPAATGSQIQDAWNAMTTAMANWEAEVDLSSYNITVSDLDSIWPNVVRNNPDLFYVFDGNYLATQSGVIQKFRFSYNPAYNQNSVAQYRAAIDRAFDEVIVAGMTDEQKATSLHDYLVQHMVYDQNANNNLGIEKRNAYEALVNGIGVCEGYTLAYAALLQKAGIGVDYCRSQAMNHIWNYVNLDGSWYHADLTWDDMTATTGQMGETGYVKHTYFLLSDDAMRQAQHNWDANSVACSNTKYDNSWHKTAPLTESAIYTVNGSSYYLKSETVVNNPNICRGASLIKRDANGTETTVGTFEIEGLGGLWPMYDVCLSRLSLSKGILYFNVGNSVYSFNPSVHTSPVKIYEHSDANNRFVSGLLADADGMTLELSTRAGIQDKIPVPLFTLTASPSKVNVGYKTAPTLTASPAATGFTWSKQRPDGGWDTINGANSSSYTIELGLPAGSYRYRAEATLDSRPVSAEVIITVTAQEEQKNFAFSESTKTVSYGDADFTITAQGAETGSTVTYQSSAPTVASVDPATGTVSILKAGSAVITATASETDDYMEATSTYSLTVSPKALKWDVSALEAADRLDSIQDSAATLYGELKVTGILDKDAGAVQFECPADKLSGVYETVAKGSQKVKLSWKDPQDKPTLQGDGSGNYTMPTALPDIMGTITVVNDSIQESPDGTKFKLQIESSISKVPDSFKDKEHLNTPGKIEKEMRLKIQERSSGIAEANIAVYDVALLVDIGGGKWQHVAKEDFPKDGLTITLPYPSGTGKDTHDFTVAHMFTEDMNGFLAGDVEYPAVTKTDNGLMFKVSGLSPVAVGWKEINSVSSGQAPSTPSSSRPGSSGDKTKAPLTGDPSSMMLYILLSATSFSVIVYMKAKKVKR